MNLHQFRFVQEAVRRGGADASGDRLERLGPARIARAVGEEDDGSRHSGS